MRKVDRMKFWNKKESIEGFEIIDLKVFIDETSDEILKKLYRTEFYNLMFFTEGTGTHEIDFSEYQVRAGEVLIISSNRAHRYSDYSNLEGFLIMFTDEFIIKHLKEYKTEIDGFLKQSYINPQQSYMEKDSKALLLLLQAMNEMYADVESGINSQVLASALRTLLLLVSYLCFEQQPHTQKTNEVFLQFSNLINRCLHQEKSVEGYAKMMHLSKKTVNLKTREAVDMSAKQFIIHQLILRIKLNLCFEKKSVSEIADELGFAEASNMTKFFKKHAGMTPKEFRSLNRSAES